MQLSTSVLPPESPAPAASSAKRGATNSPVFADATPGAFELLLPGQPVAAPISAKKPAAAPSNSNSEAAASVWAAWFAATPQPLQVAKGGECPESDSSATAVESEKTGAAVATSDFATGTTRASPDLFSIRSNFPGEMLRFSPAQAAIGGVTSTPAVAGMANPPMAPGQTQPAPAAAVTPAAQVNASLASMPAPIASVAAANVLPASPAIASSAAENVVATQLTAANVAVPAENPAGAGPKPTGVGNSSIRKGKLPVSDMAKIAAPAAKSAAEARMPADFGNKKILIVIEKQVTDVGSAIGTDNALRPPMSNSVAQSHPLSPGSSGSAPVALLQPVTTSPQANAEADTSLLAHRAVEAVMTATERVDAGNRAVVRLQFSVGDASLSVHVQLRAGEIHTTFRTDSSDLRSALASEWQAVNADSTRAIRLADPVFAPATAQNHTAGFGGGAAQQQNRGEREQADSSAPVNFPSASVGPSARPDAAPANSPALLPANLNLYTFA